MMAMLTDEMRGHLAKPLIARLATNGRNGYPSVVPLWFMLDGDDIVIISERATGKVRNLEADGRASVNIGGQPGDGLGLTLWGDCTVHTDAGHVWTTRITRHYETPEQAEKDLAQWTQWDMVYIRMTVTRVAKVWSE
jgi:general stress protein 26